MAVADSTEDQLAWESRQRPRAAAAAITAGVLTLAANVWSAAGFRGAPHAGFLESLQNVQRPGAIGGAPSVRTRSYEFFHAHAVSAIGTSVVLAVGLVALAFALTFLAAATRARRPEMPKFALYLSIIGAVLQGVAAVLRSVATAVGVTHFLAGPHTVDAAANVSSGSLLVASAFIGFAGQFVLAAGIVLVCLNAMRVGLLTRFMGIIGILVGLLQIIPFSVQPVLQAFWLLALGALFLGRWAGPNGIPPAWRTGRAEPWPSQAEVAERRRAAAEARGRGGGRRQPSGPETPAATKRPATVGAPAKRKRKRKR